MRSYYLDTIQNFITTPETQILGTLTTNNQFDLTDLQRNTWIYEIRHLQKALIGFEGRIIFEYTIPRMGKRVDVILLINNIVFLLEYKYGDDRFIAGTIDQVMDYALDLQNFQKESHDKLLVPVLIATRADGVSNIFTEARPNLIGVLKSNEQNLTDILKTVLAKFCNQKPFDYVAWENSTYMPTPTIIEAAQALYRGHNVSEISRSDGGVENLTITAATINKIIEDSKRSNRKSIIFITGVPGAGKTLAGLNIANERHQFEEEEHAVFLSGNGPLVQVLQEALARDKTKNKGIAKKQALSEATSFIQNIHHFRDDCLATESAPIEKVVIFDEAQRAWTVEQIAKFMKQKRGKADFKYSEPEFLISTMDRHKDWAVIVCLVGGGQEINTGEAGLPEWLDSLRRSFCHWDVYTSNQLFQDEYTRGRDLEELLSGLRVTSLDGLHLSASIRSFRSEKVSEFVRLLLENEKEKARELYKTIVSTYPIYFTRDLNMAKRWIRQTAHGTERYGLIASSGALRLKPEGIYVKNDISPAYWFLNGKEDVRSSYYLEDVATEFDIQGLELDYTIVAFDADFRYANNRWAYHSFSGTKWQNISDESNRLYLKNAYRVLLTRARQGMVLFVPRGDEADQTRKPEYYTELCEYFKFIGIEEL